MVSNTWKGARLGAIMVAATSIAVPIAARAQDQMPLGYPVVGPYVGVMGGFNIKANPSVKNLSSNFNTLSSGLSTPNLNLSTDIGGAGIAGLGWGFGNGLRAEVEFDYRGNSFSRISGQTPAGFGASTKAGGKEQLWGPMFNVLYDFNGLSSFVVPYVGLGIGYQRAHLSNFLAFGAGSVAERNPTLGSNDTRASFAAQGIVGAAFPIPSVPGLTLTADYRIMGLTGTRTYNAGLTFVNATGGRTFVPGTMQLGHEYNNTFMFGVRWNFGVAPPAPPPAPAPVAAPAPAPARSYLVFFDWDKATLTERARQIVKEAADNSTRVQVTRIEVNGYTDTSGTPQYNQGLSVRRAQAVANELVRDGVPKDVISIQGFGDTHLLVPTGPNVREPQNRRVEIIIR
ncbi:MAG: OmpA family protein [Rhodopila sp.]